MKQAHDSRSSKRALVEKPRLAVVAKVEGPTPMGEPEVDASREARIRRAAYALYEARGGVHGHDVDDWLAAEAALAAEASGAESKASRRAH